MFEQSLKSISPHTSLMFELGSILLTISVTFWTRQSGIYGHFVHRLVMHVKVKYGAFETPKLFFKQWLLSLFLEEEKKSATPPSAFEARLPTGSSFLNSIFWLHMTQNVWAGGFQLTVPTTATVLTKLTVSPWEGTGGWAQRFRYNAHSGGH